MRPELGAVVSLNSTEDNLDAIADRVLARLSREPFWRALHALAERHPEELVSLARVEEAKQPEAQARRLSAEYSDDAPLYTLTVRQFSALLARAVAEGANGRRIVTRAELARYFGVELIDIDIEIRRGMPHFDIEGSSENPWFDVQKCLEWCGTPLESRHPHLRVVPPTNAKGGES